MDDIKLLNAIKSIIDDSTVHNLKKFVITQENNGYRVFEKYLILKQKTGFKVKKLYSDTEHVFSSVKYALTWCTLDDRNLVYETNRINFLDCCLVGLRTSSELLERYLKKSVAEDKKFIYYNKLKENRLKERIYTKELEDFSRKAKKYQMNYLAQSSYK